MTEQEKTLLAGCLKGEEPAWDAFVLQYSNLVYNSIIRTLNLYHAQPHTQVTFFSERPFNQDQFFKKGDSGH